MKRATILCLCLLLCGSALSAAAGSPAQGGGDGFKAFWQKFRAAVARADKEAVAGLSKFPVGMSYGIRSIRNGAELRRRYREVFNEQTNAAQCFARKEPEKDAENRGRYTVACPNEAGHEVVIYEFERTRAGWKFVRLDNINE